LQVIDLDGYRENVGIVLSNAEGRVLWARRIGQDAWQFPQGGIRRNEGPEEAMYRELREEIGLETSDVRIVARTREWLRYRLPKHLVRRRSRPVCIGQKQVWYLLYLTGDETKVRFDISDEPEFDSWRWVDYWSPIREVVSFKRKVYRTALEEFAEYLFVNGKYTPISPPSGSTAAVSGSGRLLET
jgi:putative (di)nucleoside polyphosphate hydrolase